ncbi:hypothetical protein AL036_20925 [Salipiger aestuarii]|nr:hypothetical protein AL036_20925 [Salipiger aestuarii]
MENLSFQTPTFAGVGVVGGQISFANAGQVETCVGKCIDHAGAVGDQTDANLVLQPLMQLVTALGAGRGLDGVADLLGALQFHWVGPAVALVHHITQAVEGVLITGRRDIQAAARGQLQARRAEVKLDPVFVGMSDPEHVILLRVQPREGQTLEVVHDLGLLFLGRGVGGRKADHARAVSPLVAASVDQGLSAVGIAAQNLRQRLPHDRHRQAVCIADQVAVVVVGQHLIRDEVTDGTGPRAFAVAKELDQHRRAASIIWASWRSMVSRRRETESASRSTRPANIARFSQRAIWLRLPPMRPTANTRAGSTRGIGLQRRASVRPSASRSKVAADRPAASALARNWAFSAAVHRKTKVSVSGSLVRAFPAPVGFEGEACRPSQGPVSAAPAYDMGRLAVSSSVGSVAVMI